MSEWKTYPCGCQAIPLDCPDYCPEHSLTPDVSFSHPSLTGDRPEQTATNKEEA